MKKINKANVQHIAGMLEMGKYASDAETIPDTSPEFIEYKNELQRAITEHEEIMREASTEGLLFKQFPSNFLDVKKRADAAYDAIEIPAREKLDAIRAANKS